MIFEKRCPRCGLENQDWSERATNCKKCMAERTREYRAKNPEKAKRSQEKHKKYLKKYYKENAVRLKDYQKEYRLENPGKIAERARKYVQKNHDKESARKTAWARENRKDINLRSIYRRAVLKAQVLFHYSSDGIIKCADCSKKDLKQLGIDHIDENGAEHRAELGKPTGVTPGIYRWLVDNNYPSGFQVLCGSCNIKKSNKHRNNRN